MFINGTFVDTGNRDTIDVLEPSTASYLTSVPSGTTDDVDQAVAAARVALREGAWGKLKPAERERLLLKLADAIEADAQTLGEIETIDNGKAIGPCIEMDILGGVELLRYMAGFATKLDGATRQVSIPGDHFAWTYREPVGVVAAIVPWNWPFNMAMWKMAAALAVGCTMVIKPAQQTSLSMLYFAKICEDVGIPPGVINIVTGRGSTIGDYLANHPGVDKVSFTGSTPVGRAVGEAAGRALSPVTLELGGKSPMVALNDADPARYQNAVDAAFGRFDPTGAMITEIWRDLEKKMAQWNGAGEARRRFAARKRAGELDAFMQCHVRPADAVHEALTRAGAPRVGARRPSR